MTNPPATLLAWLLLTPALLVGFILPGYLATLRFPSPARAFTSVVASLLLLLAGVLICDLVRLPLNLPVLGGWLGMISLGGWWFGRGHMPAIPAEIRRKIGSIPAWIWLVGGAGLGFCALHAAIEPVAGWDNIFRWDHLARLMLWTGRLDYYPPVSAEDFFLYAWCDGIPPLVSVSNLWIYLFTHSESGALVSGRVALELALIAAVAMRLSGKLWGAAGSGVTLLALVCSPLLLYSVFIAQETGFTAFTLLLLALLLVEYRGRPALSTALWLGVTAGASALVRDYNLLFIPAAAVLLLLQRAPRGHAFTALCVGGLVAGPWYARNWFKTGNPLFAHDLGPFFPSPHAHLDTMRALRLELDRIAETSTPSVWIPTLLIGLGLPALLSLGALLRTRARTAPLWLLFLLVALLWWISIPATAGRLNYSMRVLGGGIPLLCVLAGWLGTVPRRPVMTACAGVIAVLFATDAARRSWAFVYAPRVAVWPYDWTAWRKEQTTGDIQTQIEIWRMLAREARGEAIVTDASSAAALSVRDGGRTTTIFSPIADPITKPTPPPNFSSLIHELLENKVRFVVLHDNNQINLHNPNILVQLRMFHANPPTVRSRDIMIYDLRFLREEFTRLGIYHPVVESPKPLAIEANPGGERETSAPR